MSRSSGNRPPLKGESSLAALGEFGLIERVSKLLPTLGEGVLQSIGDDAAVLRVGDRVLLVTTDALLEGVHFRRDWISPLDLGWKALAVNLSDLAAMGGEPRAAVLSLGLPADVEVGWVEEFYRGLAALSAETGCPVIGGDTVASPDRIYLNVTVLGEAPEGRYASRSGAKPGDVLLVTGTLGDSLAGYLCLDAGMTEDSSPAAKVCIRAHHRPVPRLEAGKAALRKGSVHAMMDISDGLSGDVRHIAERSGVGIRIEAARLPLSDALREIAPLLGRTPEELALAGGEDYELLMAVPPDSVSAVQAAVETTGVSLTPIGEVTATAGEITLLHEDGQEEPLSRRSWDHFGGENGG